MSVKKCPTCGAGIESRTESLTERMIDSLKRLHAAGPGAHHARKDLGLDHIAWPTFQKLKYFRLIEKSCVPGYWMITHRGKDFVEGRGTAPEWVEVFRDEVVYQSAEERRI